MHGDDLEGVLTFLRGAERLKTVKRSGWTSAGEAESVAEHTWRLCLMAMVLYGRSTGIDLGRLLRMCLIHDLGDAARREIVELWDEYEAASSPEARLAKGLDKLETILQHTQGRNPADFDYAFNLDYGQRYTAADPVLAALRARLDEATARRARDAGSGAGAETP